MTIEVIREKRNKKHFNRDLM